MSFVIQGFLWMLLVVAVVGVIFGWAFMSAWCQDRWGTKVSVPVLLTGMFLAGWVAISLTIWSEA